MFKIVRKKELNSAVTLMEIEAPFIAKKAKAGQFIIFRIDEKGERVPLTIAGMTGRRAQLPLFSRRSALPPLLWATLTKATTSVTSSAPWASPPTPRASSVSAWWAAVWAAPSHCPPLPLSRKPALRWM